MTPQINKHCAKSADADNLPIAFMLMNDAAVEAFGTPAFNFYFKIKRFFKVIIELITLSIRFIEPQYFIRNTPMLINLPKKLDVLTKF